jgi:hypothetical protein
MIEKQERYTTALVDGIIKKLSTRTMLLFAPRSSYKSTADGVDSVQWLLNAPDTRILIMTSVLRLSKELMTEIKRYFYLPPRGVATSFQLLFPEYILTGVNGRSKEAMTCPAQNFDSKEPHLWVTSLDASFVGSRCDIRKIDDAVEDKNSADDDLRESLKEKIKATNALVEPWGFTDVIGTRYFTTDWYGWRMGQVPDGLVKLEQKGGREVAYIIEALLRTVTVGRRDACLANRAGHSGEKRRQYDRRRRDQSRLARLAGDRVGHLLQCCRGWLLAHDALIDSLGLLVGSGVRGRGQLHQQQHGSGHRHAACAA